LFSFLHSKVFKLEDKTGKGDNTQNPKAKESGKNEPRVLMVGATGQLGTKITNMLLQQKKNVQCLVRKQSSYQTLVDARVKTVWGDLKDSRSLEQACSNVDTVITTANSMLRGESDNTQTVDLEGNRNLIDAAKDKGVKKFIFVSANVADSNSPVPFVKAKGKTEEHLRDSGLTYTILAPNAFMDFWIANAVGKPAIKGQPVFVVGEGRRKHSFVSETDVAKIAIASIDNPKTINQRVVIGGPEPLSLMDTIAVYEHLLGRKITVNHVAPMEPIPAFFEGPLAAFAANLLPVFVSFDMFDSPMDMTELKRNFNVNLITIREFAQGMIATS
jgi:NADH dehydrogenase